MRIVVDTNVLISATFWQGDSNEILECVERKEIELVLSKAIIDEFSEVLNSSEIRKKIQDKNLGLQRTVEKVVSMATLVEPTKRLAIVKEDPDDNKVVECAEEGNAAFIVSNDNHLLKLRQYEGILIVTPQRFLMEMKKHNAVQNMQ